MGDQKEYGNEHHKTNLKYGILPHVNALTTIKTKTIKRPKQNFKNTCNQKDKILL